MADCAAAVLSRPLDFQFFGDLIGAAASERGEGAGVEVLPLPDDELVVGGARASVATGGAAGGRAEECCGGRKAVCGSNSLQRKSGQKEPPENPKSEI